MKEETKRIIKETLFFLFSCVIWVAFCVFIIFTLAGIFDLLLGLSAATGWGIAGIFIAYIFILNNRVKLKILLKEISDAEKNRKILKRAELVAEWAHGYHEELNEDVKVYSEMIGSGVRIPTANAIATFAKETRSSDTVFLIRVNHKNRNWFMHVSGYPIYKNQSDWVLNAAKEKCNKSADPNNLVWKERKIFN